MKTIILWRRKRARTFKQEGLATAMCSAIHVRTLWQMAQAGEGTLAIVDAPTARHARAQLAAHLHQQSQDIGAPGVTGEYGKHVIVLGPHAMLAIAGASEAIRNWNARLKRDGRVRVADTRALGERSDTATFNLLDAFGEGLK
jgi:hypothetical protein